MITGVELTEVMVANGIRRQAIIYLDGSYVMPTRGSIEKIGASMQAVFGGTFYRAEQFDCNKWSKAASFIADMCWLETKSEEAALAFGMCCYIKIDKDGNAVGGHCINIALHRDGDSLAVAFYEPQPDPIKCLKEVKLCPEEISTIFCVLFC